MSTIKTLLLSFSIFIVLFSCSSEKRTEEKNQKKETVYTEIELGTKSEITSAKSLGLAYLEENDLENAEVQFKLLTDLAPNDATGYANLGVVYLRQGNHDAAEKNLLKAVELSPDDPDIRLNLAKVYEFKNDQEASMEELKKSEELAPDHVKTLYSIAEKYEGSQDAQSVSQWEGYMRKIVASSPRNIVARLYLVEALIRNGDGDEALKNLEEAQQIYPEFPVEAQEYLLNAMTFLQNGQTKEALTPVLIFHNFLKLTPEYQGGIRELKGSQTASAGVPVISSNKNTGTTLQEGESILDIMVFSDATSGAGLDFFAANKLNPASNYTSSLSIADMDGDGDHDIFYSGYADKGGATFRFLLKSDFGRFKDITDNSGIRHQGSDHSSQFVDYDNDGFLDLFVCNATSNILYKNVDVGVFENVTKNSGLSGNGFSSLFLDIDHEGDLDLIVAKNGPNTVFRNNGDGTFSESSTPLENDEKSYNTRDLDLGDFDDDGDIDLIIANENGPVQLYSNLRQGKFTKFTDESGIDFQKGSEDIEVFDYDNDGNLDILIASKSQGVKLFHNKGNGTFEVSPYSQQISKTIKQLTCYDAAVFDFDNDGFMDIIFVGKSNTPDTQGIILLHNDENGFSDTSDLLPDESISARQVVLADYNQDGDLDIFLAEMNGGIRLLRNDGGNANRHLRIQLVGLRTGSGKNNHFGIGAKVEVRAGDLYQMKVITEPGLHFGLGQREKADVVRILWTNGVPQNIFSPGSDQDLIETQELKGSCPFLYTWNGSEFVFVKDMMWRSALGMPLGIMGGKTAYAFADASEEYLKIPGKLLQEKDGKLTIQMTEELWETIYCDEIKLIAVDHPADVDIYVDEKFAPPPYPELKVHSIKHKQIPLGAEDGFGNDLLEMIHQKDDVYISNFQRGKFQGITEMKDLILDFGTIPDAKNMHLYLNGWIFPTDASINVAISQSNALKIHPPSLEVLNARGDWEVVIQNIGFPSGKNKTVIVDLSDKFLSNAHKIRIRTNMEIYWDYIFLAQNAETEVELTRLNPESADYHYRGFSKQYRKDGRFGPHWFDYGQVSKDQKWRDLAGTYTRYGDVTELLQNADDMYIIANAGDETTITFDAGKLPKLQDGWNRDYLIYSVGWVKDGDLNTALGQNVDPLPFHGMSQYPYRKNEQYPSSRKHQEYQKKYNTREVGIENFKTFLRTAKQ